MIYKYFKVIYIPLGRAETSMGFVT